MRRVCCFNLPKTSCGERISPGGELRVNGRSREESEGAGTKWTDLSRGETGITVKMSYLVSLSAIQLMYNKVGRMG